MADQGRGPGGPTTPYFWTKLRPENFFNPPPTLSEGLDPLLLVSATSTIGSFSNNDGDGSENVKKVIGLLSKTTTLHVHHAFLYISAPPLQDYNVKMPNFTF